jgi:hypothetical protein
METVVNWTILFGAKRQGATPEYQPTTTPSTFQRGEVTEVCENEEDNVLSISYLSEPFVHCRSFEVTAVLILFFPTLVQVRGENCSNGQEKLMSFIERNGVSKDAMCKHVGLQVVSACRIMQLPVQGE